MYGIGKNIALEHNGFTILTNLLERNNPEVMRGAAECIEMVTTTVSGKQMALEDKILPKLNRLLHDEVIVICHLQDMWCAKIVICLKF